MRDYKLRKKVLNDYIDALKLPAKTEDMTTPIGVDENGMLWAEAGESGPETLTLVENQQFSYDQYGAAITGAELEQIDIEMLDGEYATVVFDGTIYDEVPIFCSTAGWNIQYYIGAWDDTNDTPDFTGYPFCISIDLSSNFSAYSQTQGTHTIEVTAYVPDARLRTHCAMIINKTGYDCDITCLDPLGRTRTVTIKNNKFFYAYVNLYPTSEVTTGFFDTIAAVYLGTTAAVTLTATVSGVSSGGKALIAQDGRQAIIGAYALSVYSNLLNVLTITLNASAGN